MDTLTHIVLGGCIGEIIAGKQLGKKTLILGAIAQSIPDIDFVAGFWLSTTTDLLAHRGFTHSILFALISAPLLALVSRYFFKRADMPFRKWLLFWGLQIFVHIFLDAFNAYGTGWFEPFSHYRVSFNTIFVADPLFSVWLAIGYCALLIIKHNSTRRRMWATAAISMSALYLFISVANKLFVADALKTALHNKNIAASRSFTTPTPLNNLLWYVVAENDSGYYIGYRSVFDKTKDIDFHFAYRNDSLLSLSGNERDKNNLLRFSQGYHTAEMWQDTLVLNDLRFGEIAGWADPHPRFAFYYFLQYPDANTLIVQRGRFAKWNKTTFTAFLNRIKGI